MGLWPRKGALAVGSDADIVLLDPRRSGPILKENMHESDYTPWEGWDAAVWPSTTIQRGKVVVEDGKLLAGLSDGQFIPRKIADEILGRPAL
jgi:dihydropyrimidinase